MIKDVYEFNEKIIGTKQPIKPTNLTKERLLFALTAMYEELNEFTIACNSNNINEALDAIIDLIYFAIGRAYELGITEEQFKKCWNLVQQKNMQKKRGNKGRGSNIDAIKDSTWIGPEEEIAKILELDYVQK